tara:strand:- start:378 stop:581 length:204 start_codon:yes stop_codon:yes gene_type:complete
MAIPWSKRSYVSVIQSDIGEVKCYWNIPHPMTDYEKWEVRNAGNKSSLTMWMYQCNHNSVIPEFVKL